MSIQTDDEMAAVEVTHSPARISSAITVGAALVAVLSTGIFQTLALGIGVGGVAGVAGGLFGLQSERLTVAGVGIVFIGVIVSGAFGPTPPEFLLFGTLANIIAFDLANNAFSVGRQLSAETDTNRGEVVHAAATIAVGVVAAGLAFGIYLVPLGELTVAGLAFLLFGAMLLVWAIRS